MAANAGAREHLSGECTRTHSDRQALVPTLLIEGNIVQLMFKNHMGRWTEIKPEQAACMKPNGLVFSVWMERVGWGQRGVTAWASRGH